MTTADGRAKDWILEQLDLCHIADGTLNEACHKRRVDIARMVCGKDHSPLGRDVLASVDARAKDDVEKNPKYDL